MINSQEEGATMYDKPISYSGLSLFRKCPKAWADAYIDGNRSEPGAAARRGTKLHEQLEMFFTTDGEHPLVNNSVLHSWHEYMSALLAHNPTVERQIAAYKNWGPASFDDPTANTRGAVDLEYQVGRTLYIYDWKSGKLYDTHVDQGKYYAAMSLHRDVDNFVVRFVYLDHDHIAEWSYTRDEVKLIQLALDAEIQVLRITESYQGNPSNDNCKWCPLSWRRGGACVDAP